MQPVNPGLWDGPLCLAGRKIVKSLLKLVMASAIDPGRWTVDGPTYNEADSHFLSHYRLAAAGGDVVLTDWNPADGAPVHRRWLHFVNETDAVLAHAWGGSDHDDVSQLVDTVAAQVEAYLDSARRDGVRAVEELA